MGRRHDHQPGRTRPPRARDLPGRHVGGHDGGPRAGLRAGHAHARVADAVEHLEGSDARPGDPRRQRRRRRDRRPHARDHDRLGGPLAHGVRDVAHLGARTADLRRHAPREGRGRGRGDAAVPHVGRPFDDRRHQSDGLVGLPHADRSSERRRAGRRHRHGGHLRGPDARGPAPGLDDDRADRTPGARSRRTARRHRVRGIHRAGWLPLGTGGRARPAGERNPGQPHRSGDPTVAARPAEPDGRRLRTRRRQHREGGRGRCRPRRRHPRRAPSRGLLGAHPRLGDAVLRPDDPVVDRERSLHGPRHPAGRRS